jgi:hypothetical protein
MIPTMAAVILSCRSKHVLERAVEPVGPEVRAGLGFDQLGGDAEPRARLAHAALHHIAHAELLPDLADIDRFALVGEARIARDDEQPPDPREAGDEVLDHAVDKIVLGRIVAHILERQHSDRRLVG